MSAESIQLIQITPEQFSEQLGNVVAKKIEDFKNLFQSNPEQLLTREATAQLLDIDLSTLWYWTKKGKIKAYGISNRVYYKRSEIESALIPINS